MSFEAPVVSVVSVSGVVVEDESCGTVVSEVETVLVDVVLSGKVDVVDLSPVDAGVVVVGAFVVDVAGGSGTVVGATVVEVVVEVVVVVVVEVVVVVRPVPKSPLP